MSQKANLKNARHLLQQEIVLIEDEAHTITSVRCKEELANS
jgi:hypothetical protein